jgi:hypothetical protein
MLVIEDQKHFDEVVAFAKSNNMFDVDAPGALKPRLDYLEAYGGDPNTVRTRLFKDWAPHSFGFVIEKRTADGEWKHWFTGGLLFHGAHDGNGSGRAPTYAVTLTPTTGWSIHT